jgi:hypothetical protein
VRSRPECPACTGAGETLFCCDYDQLSGLLSAYYGRSMPTIAGEYHLKRCIDCNTFWQAQVPRSELLAELYGQWLGEKQPEAVGDPLATRDGHEVLALQSYFSRKNIRVLDFGMGMAAWARTALGLGCETYGFDLSGRAMHFASQYGIGPNHGELDYINMEQVLEHLSDPAAQIGRLSSFLAIGGIIKVSVPSHKGVTAGIAKLKRGVAQHKDIMPIWPLEHLNCFSREGVRKLAGRFGLEPFKPSARHRYAFLRDGKAGSVKELIRPEYQWVAPRNIYLWLRKSCEL